AFIRKLLIKLFGSLAGMHESGRVFGRAGNKRADRLITVAFTLLDADEYLYAVRKHFFSPQSNCGFSGLYNFKEHVGQGKSTKIEIMFTKTQIAHVAILIFLTAAIYIGSAFSPALLDDADAGHAEAAREILQRNDWVTLHINGVRYLEKAPLMYWADALSYEVFGFTEFAARLPIITAIILLVLMVYLFGQWMGGERAGFYSGLATSVGFGFYLFTRIMLPEAILALFITVSFYFFLKAYYKELGPQWYYVFYAGMAGAVLTKGLI